MKKAILGTKVGMTQMFREDGTMIPVTVVLAGPCPVVQKKTAEHDSPRASCQFHRPIRFDCNIKQRCRADDDRRKFLLCIKFQTVYNSETVS